MRIVRFWLESGKQGPQQRRKGRMTWNWGLIKGEGQKADEAAEPTEIRDAMWRGC